VSKRTPGEELAAEMMALDVERAYNPPATDVQRFAADLKERIERAAVAFDQPGQADMVAGLRYVKGIVDAAVSDDAASRRPPVTPTDPERQPR